MDILLKEEHVAVDSLMGHGGFFKTPVVGQRVMAAGMNAPITVMAVSYTHLDVYKRQHQTIPGQIHICFIYFLF